MKTISEARKDIEAIDEKIVSLLAKRQECALVIGENKRAAGTNVFVPEREEELLRKLEKIAQNLKIPHANIRAIYREIISASVALQMQRPIAYLGPEGTFTHQAARKNFGGSVELMPVRTIAEIFEVVSRGVAAYGVVPAENSNAGTVVNALDALAESDLTIVAQIQQKIEQSLISTGTLSEIKTIMSRDIALAQCSEWIMHNLPDARLVPVDSTAAAVSEAAKDPSIAAIASEVAAELHSVPVIERNIQNSKTNVTRFFVIGKKPNPHCTICEEKTSIVVFVKNEPGTLLGALEPFSKRGINLARIESRPSRQRAWEYLFFIDFIGSTADPKVCEALEELKKNCVSIKNLGSYPNVD